MGQQNRLKKTLTFFFGRKSAQALGLLGLATASVFFIQCTSKEKGQLERPKKFPQFKAQALTTFGINKRPFLSLNDNKLYWVAGQQADHPQFQAYVMDIQSQKSKRLTYQDGEIYEIITNSKGTQLYYSSSTDEIKEDSDYIRKALNPEESIESKNPNNLLAHQLLPRTEIYRSSLDGYKITRLSKRPGFDGFISLHPTTDELFYTSWSKEGPKVMVKKLAQNSKAKLKKDKVYSLKVSPSGKKQVWLEKTPELTRIWLQIGKGKPEALVSDKLGIVDFSWSPDSLEIWYSKFQNENLNNTEIYRIVLETKCQQRVTYHEKKDQSPQLDLKNNWLYFESNRHGESHIYRMKLDNLPPCAGPLRKLE